MNAFASTLSLCMRARRLDYGLETVRSAVRAGKAALLLTASDLSPKTVKEVDFLSGQHHLPHLRLSATMEEVAQMIGKKTGVIAITDAGFSAKLIQTYHETEDNLCR